MKRKIEFGLDGSFKLDLFSGGQFVSSTDYFSNFITPTGLTYPLVYPFVDCFRFLSIGRLSTNSTGSQSIGQLGTTGLFQPISSYTVSDGTTQGGTYIDWRGLATGITNSPCGTTVTESGPRFYRAWYLPTGSDVLTMNEPGGGLSIGEFMVSPSSGTDSVGKSAFSRVARNLYIPNGFRAIVSYQLKVNIKNTGLTYLAPGSFDTTNADITSDPTDAGLISTWGTLSGFYRQVWHGLRHIDNLGISYINKYGDGMEPSSKSLSKMVWYLSPDNSQFDISNSGSSQVNVTKSYQADGLMKFIGQSPSSSDVIADSSVIGSDSTTLIPLYTDTSSAPIDTDIPSEANPKEIRLGTTDGRLYLPQVDNYTLQDTSLDDNFTYQIAQNVSARKISYATPGVNGYNENILNFGIQKGVFASSNFRLPIDTGINEIHTRNKKVTRKSTFSPVSSLGYNVRFGSLVYAYSPDTAAPGDVNYFPMIDCLFFGTSGRALMPHYRLITGVYLSERGTGVANAYVYLTGSGINNNIFRFTPRQTFQGPFTSDTNLSPYVTGTFVGTDSATYPSGSSFSGTVNSNLYGSLTGVTATTGSGYGWGGVYGILGDTNFYNYPGDLGLVDHNIISGTNGLQVTPVPNNYAQLYWPYVNTGSAIFLGVSGLQYYQPDIGSVSDFANWFGGKQVVQKCNFTLLDNGYNIQPPATGFLSYTSGSGNAEGVPGYFLTTGQFNNAVITTNSLVAGTNFALTGYVISGSIIAGKLSGTTWKDTAGNIPTQSYLWNIQTVAYTVGGRTNIQRVNNLFNSLSDRGYPNGLNSNPIKPGDSLNIFFTGFSGTHPIFLTYISGGGGGYSGYSYTSGTITTTDFRPPTGYPLHFESTGNVGYRLAPNFSLANYYGSDIPSVNAGGQYPGLSLDNGLDIYLDINYSAPCGPTVDNCTDPT